LIFIYSNKIKKNALKSIKESNKYSNFERFDKFAKKRLSMYSKLFQLSLLAMILFSCTNQQEQDKNLDNQHLTLDEKGIKNYLQTTAAIQNESSALFSELNKGEELNDATKEELEKIIKKGGFNSLNQFMNLNKKVVVIFKSIHIQKDDNEQRMAKIKQLKIDSTEFKLVEKYIQELAEAFQDIDFTKNTKE
jgi:endonuclease III